MAKNRLNNCGKKIRSIRRFLGDTQESFAAKIGIKRSLLGAYEEGRAEPSLSTMIKISQISMLSLDYIMKIPFEDDNADSKDSMINIVEMFKASSEKDNWN